MGGSRRKEAEKGEVAAFALGLMREASVGLVGTVWTDGKNP